MSTSSTSQPLNEAVGVESNSSAPSIAVEPSPLSTISTVLSASTSIVNNSTTSTTTPSTPGVGGTNGVASTRQLSESDPLSSLDPPAATQSQSTTTQSNSGLINNDQPPPQVPLEDQEMLAFGTVAEQEILPPPPRDPNAPLIDTMGGGQENGATKRSMGTGATATAGPLARAKRPKNVKFR